MSQIEQKFRQFLSKEPDVEKCYQKGLINRRSLARHLIRHSIAKGNQLEAVIAMLRRFDFKKFPKKSGNLFKDIRVNLKDNIIILDFEKDKELVKSLQKLIEKIDYDKGDTLKIVLGTSSVKLFIDKKNEDQLKDLFRRFKLKHKFEEVSEISIMFSEEAIDAKGVLAIITRELFLNEIVITEALTSTPELLMYLKEEYVLKAYEIIKDLQKSKDLY